MRCNQSAFSLDLAESMWTPSLANAIAIIYKSERGTFDPTASQCPQTFGHVDL